MESLATLEAENVLLAAPAFEASAREACARLRSGPGPLIGVTFTRTPDQWLADHADRSAAHGDSLPYDVWLVCAGEQARSAAESPVRTPDSDAEVTIHTVSNPGNLTRLGVAMTKCLPAATSGDDASSATLCFESVGTLFQHADDRSIFQFFQVLTNHVTAHGVRAHYHVDPTAVGEQNFERLAILADAVVDVSAEGKIEIRTR